MDTPTPTDRARYLLERVRPSHEGAYRTRAHTEPRLRNYAASEDEYAALLPRLRRFASTRQPDALVEDALTRWFEGGSASTTPPTPRALDVDDDELQVVAPPPPPTDLEPTRYDVDDFDYARYVDLMGRLRRSLDAPSQHADDLALVERARSEHMPLDPNPYARFVQRRRVRGGESEYAYSLPKQFLREEPP